MGISIDKISPSYLSKTLQPVQDNKTVQTEKGDRNFDEILISANKQQIEEKKITEDLARQVKAAVRQSAPAEKIEVLKKAVSEGQYRIDADAVAARILMLKEDKINE